MKRNTKMHRRNSHNAVSYVSALIAYVICDCTERVVGKSCVGVMKLGVGICTKTLTTVILVYIIITYRFYESWPLSKFLTYFYP
jgi:hypothetical protein